MSDSLNAGPSPPFEVSFQAALDIANIGAWGWDESAGVNLWPARTKAIFGLPPEAEMTRERLASLLHPDDAARYREAWAAATDPHGDHIYELTYRIRRANDGAERWIHSRARVEFDDNRPVRAMGAFHDITEQRIAMARLRESEHKLSLFIEYAPASIAMFDNDMRYLAASARWNKDFGVEQTPLGLSHYEVFPEISEEWKAVHRRCLAGAVENSDGELFLRAGGRAQWVKWEARPWRDAGGEIGGIIISAEDITAANEAKAHSAHLAAIVASSSDAIISKSLKGEILSWNAGATRLFGYGAEEMVGQPVARLIPPEWIEDENRILASLRSGEGVEDYETQRLAKDGRRLDVFLTISPIRDLAGNVVGASTIMHDITDRKRVERQLRESEERLRFALSGAQAAAWNWDISNGELVWSPEGFALYGRDPRKLARYADWRQCLHPEDLAATERLIGELLAKHVPEYRTEYRVIQPSGEIRWLSAQGRMEYGANGGPAHMSGINLDITERKVAEQRLAESEARFRAAQDASLDAFLIFEPIRDADGRVVDLGIVYANPIAAQQFLSTVEQMEGRLIGEIMPGAKRPGGLIEQLGRIVESGRTAEYILEFNSDGIKGQFRNLVAPFGRYAAATFRNITAEIEGTRALAAAKAEAERANRAKSTFLASASHDLRQPVQSLVLLLSVLERQIAALPKALETARMMRTAVNGLHTLLTSVLDISRLDAGVVSPRVECVDLGDIVSGLAVEYGPKAAEKDLELRVVLRSLQTYTDPALLQRALRNLIENALRYTEHGGILLGVRQRGERVRIDVIDTGIGIPADKQAEIFEEFHQLNNPGRNLEQGLGLGLAIVARLAALLGAQLELASKAGRGSRFSLSLPLVHDTVLTMAADEPPLHDPGGRILVIEDNAIVLNGIEAVLGQWGYQTLRAVSGEAALDLAASETWRFDMIVADYRLGAGLTGIETVKEIHRRAGRSIPTLVLTGDTAMERIAEIDASGFAIAHKPVSDEELRRELARLLLA